MNPTAGNSGGTRLCRAQASARGRARWSDAGVSGALACQDGVRPLGTDPCVCRGLSCAPIRIWAIPPARD